MCTRKCAKCFSSVLLHDIMEEGVILNLMIQCYLEKESHLAKCEDRSKLWLLILIRSYSVLDYDWDFKDLITLQLCDLEHIT